MLSHQGVTLSVRIRTERCDLAGVNLSPEMGFEVSKVHARLRLSLPADQDVAPLVPQLPALMIMD